MQHHESHDADRASGTRSDSQSAHANGPSAGPRPRSGGNGPGRASPYAACLPAFLGSVAALTAILLAGLAWLYSRQIPLLTEQSFAGAQMRWRDHRLDDYEIEIAVTGRQPATYRVVVRGGVPTTAERNGHVLPQQRVWRTWTVDGMLETVRRDLVNEDRQEDDSGAPDPSQLIVRADFDPRYGYPSRYLRIQLGQPTDVSWKVTRFEILIPAEAPAP